MASAELSAVGTRAETDILLFVLNESSKYTMTPGEHVIRLYVDDPNFNVTYLQIQSNPVSKLDHIFELLECKEVIYISGIQRDHCV